MTLLPPDRRSEPAHGCSAGPAPPASTCWPLPSSPIGRSFRRKTRDECWKNAANRCDMRRCCTLQRATASLHFGMHRAGRRGTMGDMARVTIYTTILCPYCHMEKELLRAKCVAFEEVDV